MKHAHSKRTNRISASFPCIPKFICSRNARRYYAILLLHTTSYCNAPNDSSKKRSRLFHNLIRTTQRPPGYVAHNISRDPGLVDCTVDLCGHIGLHSPSPSPQCG
eukprot:g83371.t1